MPSILTGLNRGGGFMTCREDLSTLFPGVELREASQPRSASARVATSFRNPTPALR